MVKVREPLSLHSSGIGIGKLERDILPDNVIESSCVATAQLWDNCSPNDMESWFWEYGYPEDVYCAHKLIFNEEGSFFNQISWEEEYFVEQYEYGYIFVDGATNIFKYVKLGNLAWLFN